MKEHLCLRGKLIIFPPKKNLKLSAVRLRRLSAFLFEKSLGLYILFVLKVVAYSSSVERPDVHREGWGSI